MEIEIIRTIAALSMLAVGTGFDLWKREVHDYLWIGFGVFGLALLFFEPEFFQELYGLAISLMIVPLALIAWKMGFFGGADALALITLGIIAPGITWSEGTVTPFTTLLNAAILSIVPLMINVLRNSISLLQKEDIFEGFDETTLKKIAAMFLGYRAKNPKYGFSIETIEGGKKKLSLGLHNADEDEFCNKKDTWITPGLPYLIFIFAGFVVQLIYGDLIFNAFF